MLACSFTTISFQNQTFTQKITSNLRKVFLKSLNTITQSMAQWLQNGSTQMFQGCQNKYQVLDQNYDLGDACMRAIKVFLMSYPELGDPNTYPQFQSQKFDEYVAKMLDLYELPPNTPLPFLPALVNNLQVEDYDVLIQAKRVRGSGLADFRLRARYQNDVFESDVLDGNIDRQTYHPIVISLTYDQFVNIRNHPNEVIVLDIEENLPPIGDLGLNRLFEGFGHFTAFDLIIANTSPEGFEDWVDFGKGVQILISVEYVVLNEPNVDKVLTSQFHIQSIYYMLKRRLEAHNARTQWTDIGHQMTAFKYEITYLRPYVNPQSNDMFWTEPQTTPALRAPSLGRAQRRSRTVKFADIQRGFFTTDDFEGNVCLCNEWCNLNAFFYHNPIYRFLLVRHHQSYLHEMANVPEMYLCMSAVMSAIPAVVGPDQPVFKLLNDANEYRKLYYDRFELKHPHRAIYEDMHENSDPNVYVMTAIAYNKLRFSTNLIDICHQFSANPFDELCSESLIIYYNVLIDLHQDFSKIQNFVDDPDLWYAEMDALCRENFDQYLRRSYDRCITSSPGGYDYMFTIDYEYANKLSDSEVMVEIKRNRDWVLKRGTNPLNLRVTQSMFLTTFTSLSKFLADVIPRLPPIHGDRSSQLMMDTFERMDTDMIQHYQDQIPFLYQFDPNITFPHLIHNFHVFYALKLYFYGYELQRTAIKQIVKYIEIFEWIDTQIVFRFEFLWNQMNALIELNYRNTYPGEFIFQTQPDFQQVFTNFYETFYGRADHEINRNPNDLGHNVQSGYIQYLKQHFWLRSDGNNRRVFLRITELMANSLQDITNRSELVFENHIKPVVSQLIEENRFEVLDHLVYYLVRADYSVLLTTVALFFKQLHALHDPTLVANRVQYTLTKPGLISLLRTMNRVFATINAIRDLYIETYDDEFDRIAETCAEMHKMTKYIYRQFYTKLVEQFFGEIRELYNNLNPQIDFGIEFMALHLANGLGFFAAFVNQFRLPFNYLRKYLMNFLRSQHPQPAYHHIYFADCLNTVEAFLQHPSEQPLFHNPWRQRLDPILVPMNQMTAQYFNLDMNASNV